MTTTSDPYKPTALELFAGVGGFRLGLEKSGWTVSWSNQWEPSTKIQHASSCYVAQFGSEGHSNEDIAIAVNKHLAGVETIPSTDLIVGGFPCQDYSVAKSLKSALGLEGKKGVLWWEIHRLVSSNRPKFVFLENVDRLLKSPSRQRGRDFAVMLRTLGDLGYLVEWRVVNSADYGFPQRRIRVFIVATRLDQLEIESLSPSKYVSDGILAKALPFESHDAFAEFTLDSNPEKISNQFNLGGKSSPFLAAGVFLKNQVVTTKLTVSPRTEGKLGDILLSDDLVPEQYWIDEEKLPEWIYLKGAKSIERVSATGHVYKYSEGRMAFPDSLEKPSRTILTGEGGSSPSRFKHVVKTSRGYRRLVPLELERLSGFPDDWTRFDSRGEEISDARRAFFIGNALVVGLIEKVGAEIRRRLV